MGIINNDKQFIMNTYNRYGVVLEQGKGARVSDIDGKSYIDFGSGIGVNSLGYCDDGWVDAVSAQLGKLQHTSNLYYSQPCVDLAKKLVNATHADKAMFSNSGAEANEAAIKLARKYSYDKYGIGRDKILSLNKSFHGRTIATLSATGQDAFHQYYYPFVQSHEYADPTQDAVTAKLDSSYCAVMIELIQGEGGVNCLEENFVKWLAAECNSRDILLIVDEVQTGIARSGMLLCSSWYGIEPDITTLAKGLGGGLPIGTCLAGKSCSNVFNFGDHGTTFGGNLAVAAGANYIMDTVNSAEFLNGVNERGEYIRTALSGISAVKGISGKGLMLGIELTDNLFARDVANAALEQGLLVLTAKEKIRLLPPLNIDYAELEQGLAILTKVLNNYEI